MATNIGAELRRLLKKLGGTPSKYDQTNELIHKITDQVESGSGGGGLVVESTFADEVLVLSKTAGEIRNTLAAGGSVSVHISESAGSIFPGYYSVISSHIDGVGTYYTTFNIPNQGYPTSILMQASSASGYPEIYLGD